MGDTDAQRRIGGVHVHQRHPRAGGDVVPDGSADAARCQRTEGAAQSGRAGGRLHHDVVPAVRSRDGPCPEGLGDVPTPGVVVDVVDLPRTVRHRQSGRVETDALGPTTEHQDRSAFPFGQRRDHAAPRVREVVAGRRHSQQRHARRHGHRHVVRERDAEGVRDHAAPRSAGRTEPERGERRPGGRGALGGETAAARRAGAAGHRPRHDDALPDVQRRHRGPHRDHFGDAFVPDAERALERHGTADAPHHRVDRADRHAQLHGP